MVQVETAIDKEEIVRGKARLAALRKQLSQATTKLKATKRELESTPQTADNYKQLKALATKLSAEVEQLCEAEEAAVQV